LLGGDSGTAKNENGQHCEFFHDTPPALNKIKPGVDTFVIETREDSAASG
jgi:hypothetical protein